jgi:hypothetical protein
MCPNPIPLETMLKGAVTCSTACRDVRNRYLRMLKTDDKRCRYCLKPATTSQRSSFRRFMEWEQANPELAHPQVWGVLQHAGIELDTFKAAVAEAKDQDFSFEFTPQAVVWRRFPKADKPHENLDRCITALRGYWEIHAKPATETA